uniref:F-box domain-containing protein n=1 Tax=Setaria italica TaxID=4555 RepID=K3ZLB4_SETIT
MVVSEHVMSSSRWHPPSLAVLPTEVAIEITSRLAATSERPMDDLHSLWATCLFMHCVCGDDAIGRRMALAHFRCNMSWNELASYAALLTRLTLIGNPNAYFLTGIREFFREHRSHQPSLYELAHAITGGHNVAAYFVTLLYRNNGSAGDDDTARWFVRWVEGEENSAASNGSGPRMQSNKGCRLCREKATQMFGPMTPLPLAPVRGDLLCAGGGCGVTFGWPKKTLCCSEGCRMC